MGDWPTEEEEFELMYGDEMDLLREQDDEDFDIVPANRNPVRKSLNFNESQDDAQKNNQNNAKSKTVNQQNDSFEGEFTEINSPKRSSNTLSQVNEFTTVRTQTSASLFTDTLPNEAETSLESGNTQTRKRTTEDLFGDINDIILDEELNQILSQPKKRKTDKKSEDLELISKIINLREEYKTKHTLLPTRNFNKSSKDNIERDKRNLSLAVPKYPFVPVTRQNGIRVYVRFHSEDFEKEDTTRLLGEYSYFGAEGNGFNRVWTEARKLIEKNVSSSNADQKSNDIENSDLDEQNEEEKKLWVDLYKPKKYYELLSDESTNRIMLRWMKLWDKIVFNRNPKIKPMKTSTNEPGKFFKKFELNTTLDEYGRPEYKVALLCGPPGLGKTTLAHMVAQHAGYNVVEINASDERTVEKFKDALDKATQMKSVIDKEKRPNCVVFDEIDGAPPASIEFLVKYISGTAKTKGKKGGKKGSQHILKRPIICICNDVYVPALRPLRQISFIVNFPKTSSARLAERLMEIARRQQIKTDLGTMMALAEKSNHDVRSCLSVLHFFKVQNKPIGLSDIDRASVGQKDMQRSLFSVWQDIFEVKRSRNQNGMVIATPKERMENILNVMSSFGTHERVAQGVYENFPLIPHSKFSLVGTTTALDWFVYHDMIQRQIYASQNYTMTTYLNYAFVVFHFVFGLLQKVKLVYPSVGYEARTKEQRQKAVIQEILRGMAPAARSHNQALSLLLDVLPLLIKIVMPPFRPVNLNMYTEVEKMMFLRVVGVMIDYNLNYVQERTPEGTYQFNLEPNIEEVVIYKKLQRNYKRPFVSYANRQLIAREIEMETIRRVEAQVVKKSVKEPVLPNHLQTLKGKLGKIKTVEETNSQTAERYTERIQQLNGLDPFALNEAMFTTKASDFPPITNMDIVAYLVLTTSFY